MIAENYSLKILWRRDSFLQNLKLMNSLIYSVKRAGSHIVIRDNLVTRIIDTLPIKVAQFI